MNTISTPAAVSPVTALRRLEGVDLFRGLAILGVVAIHVFSPPDAKPTIGDHPLALALNQLSRFAVPLFIFLSGLVLGFAYRPPRQTGVRTFYRRRLNRILIPYIAWTVIYWAYSYGYDTPTRAAIRLSRGLVAGDMAYHLYFIVVILQMYAVFPFVVAALNRQIVSERTAVVMALAVQFGLSVGWSYGLLTITDPPSVVRLAFNRFILVWFGFFLAGVVCGRNVEQVTAWLRPHRRALIATSALCGVLTIGGAIVLSRGLGQTFADATHNWRPLAFLFSLAVCGVAAAYSTHTYRAGIGPRVVQAIGRHSFVIYLAHPLVLAFVRRGGWGSGSLTHRGEWGQAWPSAAFDLAVLIPVFVAVVALTYALAVCLIQPTRLAAVLGRD